MVRLADGDRRRLGTAQTTRENLACFRQFIARHDGDFGARKGMTAERYYQTDSSTTKGELLARSSHAWTTGCSFYGCEAALELGL